MNTLSVCRKKMLAEGSGAVPRSCPTCGISAHCRYDDDKSEPKKSLYYVAETTFGVRRALPDLEQFEGHQQFIGRPMSDQDMRYRKLAEAIYGEHLKAVIRIGEEVVI